MNEMKMKKETDFTQIKEKGEVAPSRDPPQSVVL